MREGSPPPLVTCHVSYVMYPISCVTCPFFSSFFEKVAKLGGGGSVINGATPFSFIGLCESVKILGVQGRLAMGQLVRLPSPLGSQQKEAEARKVEYTIIRSNQKGGYNYSPEVEYK